MDEFKTCGICANDLSCFVSAKCGHVMCTECYYSWSLRQSNRGGTCPFCRELCPTQAVVTEIHNAVTQVNQSKETLRLVFSKTEAATRKLKQMESFIEEKQADVEALSGDTRQGYEADIRLLKLEAAENKHYADKYRKQKGMGSRERLAKKVRRQNDVSDRFSKLQIQIS